MKVTSGFGTLTSLTAGTGRGIPSDANVAIDSSGVITMDYLEDTGCSTTHLSYGIELPAGCTYRFIQQNTYRPHSIHQCANIFSDFNADLTRVSGAKAAALEALFGAATVSEFVEGGTNTQADVDPSYSGGGGGPTVSRCSWSSSIHADNGGSNASTTGYDYDALCAIHICGSPFNKIGFHLNCASESSIAQTNTTHEYWIAG